MQNHSVPHDEALTEVEFDAEQLASLTKARSASEPVGTVTVSPAPARGDHAPNASARKSSRWKPIAAIASLGSVLALSAIVGYEGLRSSPQPPPPPPVVQLEEPPPRSATAPVSNAEPVRVRNPFDRNEVFEFPPGTTPEAAKSAMADTLLERARERQAEYDAKHPKRRRASSRPG